MLCANNHLTTACTVITKESSNPTYKCFNCASANLKHDHKASDVSCPFRAKYIATMEKVRGNKKQQSTQITDNKNTHNTHAQDTGMYVRAPQRRSYAETHNTTTKPQSNHSASNDLWTITEVTQLLLSCINDLKQCKSKLDQVVVIYIKAT